MSTTSSLALAARGLSIRIRRTALSGAILYGVLLGATPLGEISARAQLLTLLIASIAVWIAVRAVRTNSDITDRLALVGYLLLLACVLASDMPRQSIEIAFSALGILTVFWLARRELADDRSRTVLAGLLAAISLGVGGIALLSWGTIWIGWATRMGSLPPELDMPGFVFGNVHDLAILVVLCAPAALALGTGWRRLVAISTILVAVAVVTIDGSRNIILAAGVASVATVVLTLLRHRQRWFGLPLLVALVVVLGGAALALWSGLAARLLTPDTLGVRLWLWSASVDLWAADPIFGWGPGTFPWLLPLTNFHALTDFAPRHPDNALAQLLAEGGVVGVAGATTAIVAVIVGIRRRVPAPPAPALWALVFFLACGVFANPTDFGFLVLPTVLWAAFATARTRDLTQSTEPLDSFSARRRWLRRATAGAGVVAFLAALTFNASALLYEQARGQLASGDRAGAQNAVRLAAGLDPSHALYQRDVGAFLLEDGKPDAATLPLAAVVEMNPSDLAALRMLSVAAEQSGNHALAFKAATQAVEFNPTSTASLLTLAAVLAADGDSESGLDLVARALMSAPWASGALNPHAIGIEGSTADALDVATERWASESQSIAGRVEPAWLVALTGQGAHLEAAILAAGGVPAAAEALYELLSCRVNEARNRLEASRVAEGGSSFYWMVRYMVEQAGGGASEETTRFLTNVSGVIPTATPTAEAAVNNGEIDLWGYGRWPIGRASLTGVPETERAGLHEWLRDPIGTSARQVPGRPLGSCFN